MIKMYKARAIAAGALVLLPALTWANGVNVTKVKRLPAPNRDLIAFELSWQNSWNVLGPPANHDAVWVFIKFRPCTTGAKWSHALLQTTGNTPPYENGTQHTLHADLTLATPIRITDRFGNGSGHNTGAMIRRKNVGTGHIVNRPCTLKVVGASAPASWSNSVDYDIRVIAIEMVQIKAGSYKLGDATSVYSFQSGIYDPCSASVSCVSTVSPFGPVPCPCTNCYCEDACYNYVNPSDCHLFPPPPPAPLTVSSETATLPGVYEKDYYGGPYTIPASFPKGVNEFYVMKYEISQGQYADFLNTIDLNTNPGPVNCWQTVWPWGSTTCPCTNCNCSQQNWPYAPVDPTTCQLVNPINNRYYSGSGSRYGMTYTSGKYVPLEPNRACNFLSYEDLLSYLDWAALRPMTELEYEKICRGPLNAVPGEYPWGTATNLVEAVNITSPENGAEVCTDVYANLHYQGSNPNVIVGSTPSQGPLGVGIFARDTTQKRISTGAAYYGVMEMGGNVRETVISFRGDCNPNNVSCYTGIWGDGVLDNNQK
ncbi:MAG: hypothetical protein RMM53_07915, partial [Bacteroidia bacterium]|nr:hypothetical protein [Bacteroidia bacterium]MDW8334126.1 hypothetical protein [Bacteroidia bacterium]